MTKILCEHHPIQHGCHTLEIVEWVDHDGSTSIHVSIYKEDQKVKEYSRHFRKWDDAMKYVGKITDRFKKNGPQTFLVQSLQMLAELKHMFSRIFS